MRSPQNLVDNKIPGRDGVALESIKRHRSLGPGQLAGSLLIEVKQALGELRGLRFFSFFGAYFLKNSKRAAGGGGGVDA